MKCRIFVKAETGNIGCTEMLSEEIIENVTYSQKSGEFTVIDNDKIDRVVELLDIEDGVVNIVFEKEFERIKFNDCNIYKFALSNTNGNKTMTLGFTADEREDEDICDEKMLTTECEANGCVSGPSDFPEEDENPKCSCICDCEICSDPYYDERCTTSTYDKCEKVSVPDCIKSRDFEVTLPKCLYLDTNFITFVGQNRQEKIISVDFNDSEDVPLVKGYLFKGKCLCGDIELTTVKNGKNIYREVFEDVEIVDFYSSSNSKEGYYPKKVSLIFKYRDYKVIDLLTKACNNGATYKG